MRTYETIQGDTWDLIAYKLYGNESYMRILIEANLRVSHILVFSSGTLINVPDASSDQYDEDLPAWRDLDSDEEDEEDADEEFIDDEEDEEDGYYYGDDEEDE